MSGVDAGADSSADSSVVYTFTRRTRVRRAARLLLAERFNSVWECLPAALAGDPETGVHIMRVETKRLREAMRLFRGAYVSADFKLAIGEIGRVNDLLGHVRDADVMLGNARTALGDDPLLDDYAQASNVGRQQHLTALCVYLAGMQNAEFENRFRSVILNGRKPVSDPIAGDRLIEFAPLEVGRRLQKVVKRLHSVSDSSDVHGLHAARVANKHLRYALEAFVGLYGRRFVDVQRQVVALHKSLGDVHDLDVLNAKLVEFADKRGERMVAERWRETIAALRAEKFVAVSGLLEDEAIDSFAHQVMDAVE